MPDEKFVSVFSYMFNKNHQHKIFFCIHNNRRTLLSKTTLVSNGKLACNMIVVEISQ